MSADTVSFIARSVEMNNLIVTCESITQEAFSFSDIGRVIQTKVGKLSAVFKDLARFMGTWDYSKPTVLNSTSLQRILNNGVRYTDISDMMIFKPNGFRGDIEEYTQVWKNNRIDLVSKITSDLLIGGQKFLGYYLNDPVNLDDKRIVINHSTIFTDTGVQSLLQSEKKWYPGNEKSGDVQLASVFSSSGSLIAAFDNLNLINTSIWEKANPKTVSKEFLSYTGLAEALFTVIQSNEHPVSPIVLKEIAHRIELTARWIEAYSALITHLNDMTSSMKQTEEKILKSV